MSSRESIELRAQLMQKKTHLSNCKAKRENFLMCKLKHLLEICVNFFTERTAYYSIPFAFSFHSAQIVPWLMIFFSSYFLFKFPLFKLSYIIFSILNYCVLKISPTFTSMCKSCARILKSFFFILFFCAHFLFN